MIIILGGPGSGKNTQINLLSDVIKYQVFSLGDYLRSVINTDTNDYDILNIKNKINNGECIDKDMFIKIIKQEIKHSKYILNGLPRNIEQAKNMEEFFNDNNLNVDLIINLEVDSCILNKRMINRKYCSNCKEEKCDHSESCLKCKQSKFFQRTDDEEKIILKRIEKYEQEKNKLEEFYAKQMKYYKINANRGVEEVHNCIKDLLVIKNFVLI